MTLTHTGAPPRRHPTRADLPARHRPRPETRLLLAVLAALGLWGIAIATFGYPAIILPALVAVPAMFVTLLVITWG